MSQISIDDFYKVEICVGTVLDVKIFEKARKPAYQLQINFGSDIGIRNSSAQITALYTPEQLLGKQVLAVVNFPPRQIANYFSEVLVLGLETPEGVVILQPERPVENGTRVS